MKLSLLTLPLGLALSFAVNSAFATTGTINFAGKITSATCPIEIVNPETGVVGNLVPMGEVDASAFTSVGTQAGGRGFQMRITPNSVCVMDPTKLNATVTFTSVQGGGGDHYGIKPVLDAAKGVAVAIQDLSGSLIPSGSTSAVYPLSETDPTLMYFVATYISTQAAVSAGPADADVSFSVNIH